jgi:FkbM family methyltransferase
MREFIGRMYAALFARPGRIPQAVNHALYHLALRGMGYNNGWQLGRSGEYWFIQHALGQTHNPVVIDVGANRGEYSRAVLNRIIGARVLAFEPLAGCRETLDQLKIKWPRFGYRGVALGAVPDRSRIFFGEADSEWSSLSADLPNYAARAATHESWIEVSTLDAEVLGGAVDYPRVDLLKIDVEGFEIEVLQGARRLIEEMPPRWVQVEWNLHQLHRGHTLRQLGQLLPGYVPFQLLPGRHGKRQVDLDRPEANTFCYSNFVFARPDTYAMRQAALSRDPSQGRYGL